MIEKVSNICICGHTIHPHKEGNIGECDVTDCPCKHFRPISIRKLRGNENKAEYVLDISIFIKINTNMAIYQREFNDIDKAKNWLEIKSLEIKKR